MICPKCSTPCKCYDSRMTVEGVARRHKCQDPACGHRCKTIEVTTEDWEEMKANHAAALALRKAVSRIRGENGEKDVAP